MAVAYSILPEGRFKDQRDQAILAGLYGAGYQVCRGVGEPKPGDVLVTWTVQRGWKEDQARAFEKRGGRVIVCEEGHLPPVNGEKFFSLCLGDHQKGPWHEGGPERWASLGVPVAPWRVSGSTIVVREQRGIGSTELGSPPAWHEKAAAALRKLTDRAIVIRRHPKLDAKEGRKTVPLDQAMTDAWCLVTWASSDATKALLMGVPAIWCAPWGMSAEACGRRLEDINDPRRPERLPVFERLAHCQWRIAEIAAGLPFRSLREAA